MNAPGPENLTQILSMASHGDGSAAAQLLPMVYEELRRLARSYFQGRQGHNTLQPTALVHEAFAKLIDADIAGFRDRAHFFAVAATAMRQIMIDHVRSKRADKRGGDWQRISFDHADVGKKDQHSLDVLDLDDALTRLGALDPRKAKVVELRVFGGLTCEEAAQALDVSLRTVQLDWLGARAWLRRELEPSDGR